MEILIMCYSTLQKNFAFSLGPLSDHQAGIIIPFWVALVVKRASLVAQLVKNLPAMQEALVQFLGGEDPLEKG